MTEMSSILASFILSNRVKQYKHICMSHLYYPKSLFNCSNKACIKLQLQPHVKRRRENGSEQANDCQYVLKPSRKIPCPRRYVNHNAIL